MKNLKIVLLAVTASFFAACDTDITQPGELYPDEAIETVDDIEKALNGVYDGVPGENQIYFTSIFTDEVAIGIANGGQGLQGELAFLLNNQSGDAASIWVSNYYAITLANWLLQESEDVIVEAGSAEEARKLNYLAQTRALRAFAHFQLLSYFSPDMTDDSALGVPVMDFVPENVFYKPPRATNAEVFALIEADLAYAEEHLIDPGLVNTRITPDFFLAFRARMAAYRGNYALAKEYVDELGLVWSLTPKAQYEQIWEDIFTPGSEVIFKLARANDGSPTGNFAQFWSSVNPTVTGSPFFEVNRALFNLVNDADDVRRFVIVDESAFDENKIMGPEYTTAPASVYKQNDVLPVGKYPGSEDLIFLNDVKVFRFSEMVLIRAEYYASIGDFENAIAQVNLIRAARYGNTSGNISIIPDNAADVWYAIMNERRAELAFEGHRYIDIKRLGTLAGRGVERDPRDCEFNGFCTLPATDHRFTLPIPRQEQAANPTIVQNPGYNN